MGKPIEIPDWKIYKVGDHTPKLQDLEKRLASHGLKDPWIRNHVWRYDASQPFYQGSQVVQGYKRMFKGFLPGLALAIITVGIQKYMNKDDHDHDSH